MNWLVLRIKVKVKMEGKKLVSAAVDCLRFLPRRHFVPGFISFAFLTAKEQITLLNSLSIKCHCQDTAYSDYHYNTKTQRI